MGLCFVVYMFLSCNPSSGDINLSNLSCFFEFIIGGDLSYKTIKWTKSNKWNIKTNNKIVIIWILFSQGV